MNNKNKDNFLICKRIYYAYINILIQNILFQIMIVTYIYIYISFIAVIIVITFQRKKSFLCINIDCLIIKIS